MNQTHIFEVSNMTAHCPKCGAQTDTYFKCVKGCDVSPQETTKAKLIIAIDALEEIAKRSTFTETRLISTVALEKIK